MTTGFDDYLRRIEEIKREATLAERDRIIALLEANVPHSLDHYLPCWQCQIIELINGENK